MMSGIKGHLVVWLKPLHTTGASMHLDHVPYRSGSEILNQPNVKLASSVTSEFVALILSLGYHQLPSYAWFKFSSFTPSHKHCFQVSQPWTDCCTGKLTCKGAFQVTVTLLLEKIMQPSTAKFIAKFECSKLAVPTSVQLGWLKPALL